jgi:hypothetical protein
MTSEEETPFAQACFINHGERDISLNLDADAWPHSAPATWVAGRGNLQRVIAADDDLMAEPIRETLLRFPSAPLHGWQRLHEYHVNSAKSQNFHTYRVLAHPERLEPVKRIFFMHNGLNELDNMKLYYQLASHLVHADDATACIVRPFPGHLTRFPCQAFGETPLDRYLWDGSHLFCQYLRYMVETQWLLSTIVRRSSYRSLAGADLLGEHNDPDQSRLSTPVLAEAMFSAWQRLYNASATTLREVRKTQPDGNRLKPPVSGVDHFIDAIDSLRCALRLTKYASLDGTLNAADVEPELHVLGYSLGGFTAQSVFMSWPFLIASCCTILSGGALRELSPTAFAHPEEWQTVLHSLRYELDDAMMDGRNGRDARNVAGMEEDLFLYLKRTFYEVFQQEYRGSFQSRLVAFLQRMLFVVGGNDPIVQTRHVLDSGPQVGLNMLTIGRLGHFLAAKPRDSVESEQRAFWLPEMARLVDRFSDAAAAKQTEERPYTWVDGEMQFVAYPPPDDGQPASHDNGNYRAARLSAPERLAIAQDGALPGRLFERCLDDLLARQDENSRAAPGLLLILRNELPTVLLDDMSIYEHGEMLNHDDLSIARYIQGVRARREILLRRRDRIALVIPWNASRIMGHMDTNKGFPSQAEAPKGKLPRPLTSDLRTAATASCMAPLLANGHINEDDHAEGWVRLFDGRRELDTTMPLLDLARRATRDPSLERVPSLPDCWIWMSRDFLGMGEETLTTESGIQSLDVMMPARCRSSSVVDRYLRSNDLRIITVSRARYNPRFRGRMVVDPAAAKNITIHAALCAFSSEPIRGRDPVTAATAPASADGAL